MILKGKRNITATSIHKLTKILKLNKKEAQYFENLVMFNQAKKDKDRDYYFNLLQETRPSQKLTLLQKNQLEFFSKKYIVVIHQMMLLPNFKGNSKWIAENLNPPVTQQEALYAFKVMKNLKLIEKDKDGNFQHTSNSITTDAETDSFHLYKFHREMLNDAKVALIEENPALCDITSLTIPVPKKSIPAFKKKIQGFRETIIDWINKGSEDFYEVFQLNIQLFPTTKTKKNVKTE